MYLENFDVKSFMLGYHEPEAEGTRYVTSNGTFDITSYALVEVDVPNPATGTKQITSNGTYDVLNYAAAAVNIPHTFGDEDEGKVIQNGSLVTQTSRTISANGTYDTTARNEIIVEVPTSGVTPSGTLQVTANGDYNVSSYATATVNVPTGVFPTGTKSITANGTYNISEYAAAFVNIPNTYTASDNGKVVQNGALVSQTSLTKTVNGTFDTTTVNSITINVPTGVNPTGTTVITTNGTYNVANYASAYVNVTEGGGITPTGTRIVEENGTFDVTSYAAVYVNVPTGITPTGSISITQSGTYDVTNYSQALVNIPSPSGTVSILGNGQVDVTNYSVAYVNVPNTYVASDSGKVVQNGGLVSQTQITVTTNGTYNTITNDQVVVNVPSGVQPSGHIDITDTSMVDVSTYATAMIRDSNLISKNIKEGVTILGIDGSFNTGGLDKAYMTLTTDGTHDYDGNAVLNVYDHRDLYQYDYQGQPYGRQGDDWLFFRFSDSFRYTPYETLRVEIDTVVKKLPQYFLGQTYQSGSNYTKVTIDFKNSPIEEILSYAFTGTTMEHITLPSTLTSIGNSAFSQCNKLQEVTIPASVDWLMANCFSTCSSLTEVYFEGTPSNAVASTTFNVCNNLTDIYVPWAQGAVNNAPWGASNATVHYNYTPS